MTTVAAQKLATTKVKLASALDSAVSYKIVIFEITPQLTETGGVDYTSMDPVHSPGQFMAYKSTRSRVFGLQAKFASRTPAEARKNLQNLNILRGWRYPYFGMDSTQLASNSGGSVESGVTSINTMLQEMQSTLKQRMGLPPEVLYLSAYSPGTIGGTTQRGNLANIPVVMTNLNIVYANDVDYIVTSQIGTDDPLGSTPFPTLMDVTIDLTETHSPYEFSTFNLARYYSGLLEYF